MPSNRRLVLTPEAGSDLAAIVQFGAETWGESRAIAYAQRLWQSLENLSPFPAIGRKRDDLSPGLRSHPKCDIFGVHGTFSVPSACSTSHREASPVEL